MGWQDLLTPQEETRVLPWFGGRRVHSHDRTWTIKGRLPPEHGWYTFAVTGGREATFKGGSVERDPDYEKGHKVVRGFLVGDRLIRSDARVEPDPHKIIEQTTEVFCVDPGLDRFQRAAVAQDREGRLVFMRLEFPEGPETDVLEAYQDRKASVAHIAGVTPPLDLAFRWLTYQRAQAEVRAAELARIEREEAAKAAEIERVEKLMKQTGTAEGRRALAVLDFNGAAKAALRVSGAELLDVIATHRLDEMRVQFRFRERRFECVVHKRTLRVTDAGVCLTDHNGVKGDTWFTLESLPGVIGEAIDSHRLHVYRHLDREPERDDDDDQDDRW